MAAVFGASGTDLNEAREGALRGILQQTAGGSANADKAIALAQQLYPDTPKADPYEAAFQFFAEMGRQASQPGATVLSSAVGSMQVPMDYLNAKKKEAEETERARMTTALSLGPSLKPKEGKVTYRPATEAELTRYRATSGQMGSDGKFYDLSKTSGSEDKTRMTVVLKGVADDPETPIDERITSIMRSDFDSTKHLPTDALPEDPSSSEDNTLIDIIDRSVIDDPLTRENEQIKTIKRSEFDSDKHVQVGAVEGETLNLEEIVKAERELRNEYVKRSEDFKEAQRNYATIKVSEEEANGPGDVALITSFMKMLDPGSVVRETEFANARDTAGLLESLGNALKKAETGEFLNPTQRSEFTALAEKYLYAAQNQQLKVRQSLGTTVQNYGLTPSNVFGVEIAPSAAYLNSELIDIAIETNQTVDKLWSVMSEAERRQYGG
jgi:hypothetical protein